MHTSRLADNVGAAKVYIIVASEVKIINRRHATVRFVGANVAVMILLSLMQMH